VDKEIIRSTVRLSMTGVIAFEFLSVFDTVGWATGKAASL